MIFKRVCSSIAAVSLMLGGTAFASDSIFVKYNNSEKCVEIDGRLGESANALVSVSVYEDSDSIDFSKPVLFSSFYTTDDGVVDFEFKTTSAFQIGKYVVYLSSKDANENDEFNYVSEDGLIYAMNLINGQTESEAISDIIKSSKRNLGLDENVSDSFVDTLSEIFGGQKEEQYTESDEFYEDFVSCLAMAHLNENENTPEVMKIYESELGIEMDEINKLDSRILSAFYDTVKNADYTKVPLSVQLPELVFTADILKCESWSELKYVVLGLDEGGKKINNNFEIFKPDTEYYDKVDSVNDVYKEMFGSLKNMKMLDDIRNLFEESAKKVYREEDSRESSGGGGSRGSSGGGNVALSPYVPVEIITPDVPGGQGRFSDIETHWAKEDIETMASLGVISGYPDGSFMPDKAVTRAEFVKLITLAFEIGESEEKSEFSDVAPDAWYKQYVDSAVGAGLVRGVSEQNFNPEGILSREDASLILYRYITSVAQLEAGSDKFNDDSEISDYAKDAVYALSGAGIINGIGNGEFSPGSELTRAQACKLLSSINAYLAALK